MPAKYKSTLKDITSGRTNNKIT